MSVPIKPSGKKRGLDALDTLREECKKIQHGVIRSNVIIKDGIAVEVVVLSVTKKLRAKKK